MKIDINEMVGTEAEISFTAPVSEFASSPDNDIVMKEDVRVKGKVEKFGLEIILTGKIKTTLELECSRCLEHFLFPIDEGFQIILEPFSPKTNTAEEIELTKGELDLEFYKDGIIDVTEIVREQLFLAMPMITLCREECKGLCSQCGENLNNKQCACAGRNIDPGWSKLESLITKKTTPN